MVCPCLSFQACSIHANPGKQDWQGTHWAAVGDAIQIATSPRPSKAPIGRLGTSS
ncbi:hypothetical protein BDW75DRAFT_183239 [Aspergillus navahoensis]